VLTSAAPPELTQRITADSLARRDRFAAPEAVGVSADRHPKS
jgi:hypothetical protein